MGKYYCLERHSRVTESHRYLYCQARFCRKPAWGPVTRTKRKPRALDSASEEVRASLSRP